MRKWIRGRPELRERARLFRKPMTATEARLWQFLRGRRLRGLKFRRQHPLHRYIADFYCAEHRLVVEVDGSVHDDPAVTHSDRLRDEWLESRGYRILRFSNSNVESDLSSVLAQISAACYPLPQVGEGGPMRSIGTGEGRQV